MAKRPTVLCGDCPDAIRELCDEIDRLKRQVNRASMASGYPLSKPPYPEVYDD